MWSHVTSVGEKYNIFCKICGDAMCNNILTVLFHILHVLTASVLTVSDLKHQLHKTLLNYIWTAAMCSFPVILTCMCWNLKCCSSSCWSGVVKGQMRHLYDVTSSTKSSNLSNVTLSCRKTFSSSTLFGWLFDSPTNWITW